ncbi:MLO-like protein 5 [Sarracenia purpurea var. burkii]
MKVADTMLPCPLRYQPYPNRPNLKPLHGDESEHHRRLLWNEQRFLAADTTAKWCKNGYFPLISVNGLHQLHIFIFFLAVFHVMYSAMTMMLGRMKMRRWKEWERETVENNEVNDPTRFRLTHETSFVKEHTSFWIKTPYFFYFVCFFRQFFRSVRKADYLTMRHGFISVHLAPGSKFDFQKYIKRSLEDDFKVVVGIRMANYVLGFNYASDFGTKLQAIIARMAVEIQERHAVVQGIPLVQVSDRHFWFNWPHLILYLIHLTQFQYEFGLKSCFNKNFTVITVRVSLGLGVQFLCSYITLPLYALVTQMGSNMKKSIFDEQTTKALKNWHKNAMKKMNERKTGNAEAMTAAA